MKQNYYVWQCYTPSSPLSYVSVALVYTHVAIQQIAALILAIKIRKVKIKTLNDSKYVVALVYISSMTVAIMALMTFSLGAYLNLSNVVYNGGFLFASTMFLLLLFVPKVSVFSVYVHIRKECHVTSVYICYTQSHSCCTHTHILLT